MIGKNKIERMCRMAGMVPVKRDRIGEFEVFIADGFSAPPHWKFKKFDIQATDFPFGCFVTLWWVGDEKMDTGQPLFFDAFHDPELSKSSKQTARINTAFNTAKDFLTKRRQAHARSN